MRLSKSSSLVSILIVAAAIALWIFDTYRHEHLGRFHDKQIPHEQDPGSSAPTEKPTRTGRYETYTGCTLVEDRTNDGDSFRVKLPSGRTEVIRLYFVDCPESAFKTYSGGQNNYARIDDQATDMGGITPQQAVEIGEKAKEFTLSLLGKEPFTLHTVWNSPFKDKRYSGFIVIHYNGKNRFLHEILIEKGYARIHTKGAQLPDGTSERKQKDHLRDLQRTAKQKER